MRNLNTATRKLHPSTVCIVLGEAIIAFAAGMAMSDGRAPHWTSSTGRPTCPASAAQAGRSAAAHELAFQLREQAHQRADCCGLRVGRVVQARGRDLAGLGPPGRPPVGPGGRQISVAAVPRLSGPSPATSGVRLRGESRFACSGAVRPALAAAPSWTIFGGLTQPWKAEESQTAR